MQDRIQAKGIFDLQEGRVLAVAIVLAVVFIAVVLVTGAHAITPVRSPSTTLVSLRLPNVVGLPAAGATQELSPFDLRVSTSSQQSGVAPGRVVAEVPAPGSVVLAGSNIRLIISAATSPATG